MTDSLPPREREIFDTVFKNPDATVAEVIAGMQRAPSASAVRTMLKRLVGKQLITETRREEYISYRVRLDNSDIVETSLHRVVNVFFAGSRTAAVNALLGIDGPLSRNELDELKTLIIGLKPDGDEVC